MPVCIDKPFAKILIVQIADAFPPFNPIRQCRVALNRNLEKIEEANKVYISNQGATLWQKKINLKNRNVAA